MFEVVVRQVLQKLSERWKFFTFWTAISTNGGNNQPTGDPSSADGEVELDIEVASSIAPGGQAESE
jgi:hypothetical protein